MISPVKPTLLFASLPLPQSEPSGPFALKALTKEWTRQTTISTTDPAPEQEATPPKPPSRYSIIQGFNNLKKELALLAPLRNPHVIQLHGVVLRPLGLILEHAPGGSLKKTLEQFHELQQHLRGNVVQAVIIQVWYTVAEPAELDWDWSISVILVRVMCSSVMVRKAW